MKKKILTILAYFTIFLNSNLSSNENNSDDNASNVFRTTTKSYNYELGLGFEFYLYYFKFSPSLRGIKFLKFESSNPSNLDLILIDEILYLSPSVKAKRTENPLWSGSKSPCFFKILKFTNPLVK